VSREKQYAQGQKREKGKRERQPREGRVGSKTNVKRNLLHASFGREDGQGGTSCRQVVRRKIVRVRGSRAERSEDIRKKPTKKKVRMSLKIYKSGKRAGWAKIVRQRLEWFCGR